MFADLDVGAVKIGMLSQSATIEAVAQALDRHRVKDVVLDPVMVASSGDRLLANGAVEGLRRLLVPRARVITPNLPEAALLLDNEPARDESEMEAQARMLIERFHTQAVLIKGGHGAGAESVDLLVGAGGAVIRLAAPRVATKNTHGTGCTMSSAVATGLAKGLDLTAAVRAAKTYVTAAIAGAETLAVGHGHGPLHHFCAYAHDLNMWEPACGQDHAQGKGSSS